MVLAFIDLKISGLKWARKQRSPKPRRQKRLGLPSLFCAARAGWKISACLGRFPSPQSQCPRDL